MNYQSPNSIKPFDQFVYLIKDLQRIVNHKRLRWISMWISGTTYSVISYRLDRFGFLLFHRSWAFIRFFFFPFAILFHIFGAHHDIHYSADIGPGFLLLHGNLGVVINGHSVIGKNLIITGGNCIGGKGHLEIGDIVLGDNVFLGANAVILGPIKVGNNVRIGAGAVVVDNAPDNVVLVGVPAKVVIS